MPMTLSPLPLRRALSIALALAAITASIDSAAQTPPAITTDTSGVGTTVNFSGNAYTVTGGTVNGTNLFHSFGRFNVPTSGSATFSGPVATANVISRVTGGEASTVHGLIRTRVAMPDANFIFINPAGVTFGGGASLDIGGAFRVSTADYIKLGADGPGVFYANPERATVLGSAPPTAFGFLVNAPAAISVTGSLQHGVVNQAVPGKTLTLVGGNVQISGAAARVLAPRGAVQIASVASPGEVDLTAADLGFGSLGASLPARLGEVTVSGGALVNALDLGRGGGTVFIRSGQLTIEDQGTVVATNTSAAAGPAVGLDLRATESMSVRNGAVVQSQAFGNGSGSGISIEAGTLSVTGGGIVQTQAFGGTANSGNGGRIDIAVGSADIVDGRIRTISAGSRAGDIRIDASGTVTVAAPTGEIPTGEISTVKTNSNTAQLAGDIVVNAADVVLRDRGKIQSGNRIGGLSGANVNISAANTLSIASLAGISSQTSRPAGGITLSAAQFIMDSGFINTSTHGAATAGPVLIDANSVSLANGAQIVTSSQLGTTGAAGSITIDAPGSVTISGIAPDAGVGAITFSGSPRSGIFSTAQGSGNAGQIALVTPILTVADGGRISVATQAAGNAGTMSVDANTIALTGGARLDSSTTGGGAGGAITITGTGGASSLSIVGVESGLFSTASGTGNAGQIAVSTGDVTVSGGGRINSSTTSGGAGGAIAVTGIGADSMISIAGVDSGLFSTASGTGAAGQIAVSAGTLTVADAGRISVATEGAGNAGSVSANVTNLTVSGGARIDSSTTNAGAGGPINLTAGNQVEIVNGGSVRADSLGSGVTGNITISAGDRIVMTDGSISTRAATSDGGNIVLVAPNIIRLIDSQITTSVESGSGGGGNISIDPQFVILNGSAITANAFGGPGGNITIVADNFLADATSVLQASSALSTPGTVQIQSPENNVAGDIAQLPRELVDASRLLRGGCSARQTGAPSSFTVAGRGGVPVDPDGYLPSFSASAAAFADAPAAAAGQGFALAMAGWDCWR